jgi:hypothetical protein
MEVRALEDSEPALIARREFRTLRSKAVGINQTGCCA